MLVTLTFDNGPTPGVTEAVLDALAERGLRAWFFVVGERAARHHDLLERIHRCGHLIGNHTWSHADPLGDLDGRRAVDELARTDAVIGALACVPPVTRPCGRGGTIGPHLLGPAATEYVRVHRHTVALWNNVPGDWFDEHGWAERAWRAALDERHSVIVLHDIEGACLAELPSFLDRLIAGTAEFVTDFPEECLPIIAGQLTPAFAAIDWRPPMELAAD